jgi:hypothetical protein
MRSAPGEGLDAEGRVVGRVWELVRQGLDALVGRGAVLGEGTVAFGPVDLDGTDAFRVAAVAQLGFWVDTAPPIRAKRNAGRRRAASKDCCKYETGAVRATA